MELNHHCLPLGNGFTVRRNTANRCRFSIHAVTFYPTAKIQLNKFGKTCKGYYPFIDFYENKSSHPTNHSKSDKCGTRNRTSIYAWNPYNQHRMPILCPQGLCGVPYNHCLITAYLTTTGFEIVIQSGKRQQFFHLPDR